MVQPVRTAKRISEAIGYLELGMTRQALASMDEIEQPGPFGVVTEMLRGEAARLEHRLEDAAQAFETAARLLPAPQSKPLWLASSMFHRQTGNTVSAIETLANARGARPPVIGPKAS